MEHDVQQRSSGREERREAVMERKSHPEIFLGKQRVAKGGWFLFLNILWGGGGRRGPFNRSWGGRDCATKKTHRSLPPPPPYPTEFFSLKKHASLILPPHPLEVVP